MPILYDRHGLRWFGTKLTTLWVNVVCSGLNDAPRVECIAVFMTKSLSVSLLSFEKFVSFASLLSFEKFASRFSLIVTLRFAWVPSWWRDPSAASPFV